MNQNRGKNSALNQQDDKGQQNTIDLAHAAAALNKDLANNSRANQGSA